MENEQLQIARFENMEINCIQTNTMDAMDSLTIVEKKDLLHTINNSPLKMQHVVKKYMIMIFVIVALGVPLTVYVCVLGYVYVCLFICVGYIYMHCRYSTRFHNNSNARLRSLITSNSFHHLNRCK